MFLGASFVSRHTCSFSNVPEVGLVRVNLCAKS